MALGGRSSGAAGGAAFASVLASARGRATGEGGQVNGAAHASGAWVSAIGERRSGPGNGEASPEGDGGRDELRRLDAASDHEVGVRRASSDADVLDPSARQLAGLAPPAAFTTPLRHGTASGEESIRARSLEELLPELVRRIAWTGDKHRGTAFLELGAGTHAGTTLVVHAEGGRVRVEVSGREGAELDRLRARLDVRLRGHGLDVESVT